jgi:hypothetical protein
MSQLHRRQRRAMPVTAMALLLRMILQLQHRSMLRSLLTQLWLQ